MWSRKKSTVLLCLLLLEFSHAKKFGQIFLHDHVQEVITSRTPKRTSSVTLLRYSENNLPDDRSCDDDVEYFRKALMRGEFWSYKMLDASSKLPSGLLEGNLKDIGMYDECVSIEEPVNDDNATIKGRHCMYVASATVQSNTTIPLTLSTCFSHRCNEIDLAYYLNGTKFLNLTGSFKKAQFPDVEVKVTGVTCTPVDQEIWTIPFAVSIFVLVVWVTFLMLCTWIDSSDSKSIVEPYSSLREFSLLRAARKILGNSVKKDNSIPVLNGLRFFNMAWVLLGHQFIMNLMSPNVNNVYLLEWVKSWRSLYIFSAPYAVDSFFAMNGFLMTYLFLKHMKDNNSFNIFGYYIHRYLRLTPAVLALLIFNNYFMQKIGSGALWNLLLDNFAVACQNNPWNVLTYSQNLFNKNNACLTHLWYLATEMQLFLVSPIILLPLHYKPKVGLKIVAALLVGTLIIHADIVGINKYHMLSVTHIENMDEVKRGFQDVYTMPYTRAAPWLVGIFFGYAVTKKINFLMKILKVTGLWLAFGAFTFCILGLRYFMRENYEYDLFLETLFSSISKPIWGFGISWIIYASMNSHRGVILKILSQNFLAPISRLSYCIYLVHLLVLLMTTARTRNSTYFSDYYIWTTFLSNFMLTVTSAFFFSILFESPIIILEKILKNKTAQKS